MSAYYPIMLNMNHQVIAIIGGGSIAARKVEGLLVGGIASEASITVIAPALCDQLLELANSGQLKWLQQQYEPAVLKDATLVFAATDDAAVNTEISKDAQACAILVCNVSDGEQGSFITPAVARHGSFVAAVSTSGGSPGLAKAMKQELQLSFLPRFEHAYQLLSRLRHQLHSTSISEHKRREILQQAMIDAVERPIEHYDAWYSALYNRAVLDEGEGKQKMEARVIKVGTRQSQLALTQTGQVIKQLEELCQTHGLPYSFEIHKIVTKGDQILDVTLSKVGGKGLFVKEIEQALLNGDIDLAIHSMKDMPYELPQGLIIGAVPQRLTPQDCLIMKDGSSLHDLPLGAKVGTSSLRRSSQLKHARPDLDLQWIRGNIDSRIRKLDTEGYDAIVLAAAGLTRMGWQDKISTLLPADLCVPAVGQGALGVQCRGNDEDVVHMLSLLNDHDSEVTVAAERSFLGTLQGGCQVPIGAHATIVERNEQEEVIEITGIVGSPDGETLLKVIQRGTDPIKLGAEVARQLLDDGARDILAKIEG